MPSAATVLSTSSPRRRAEATALPKTPKVPVMCNFGEKDQSPTPEQARQLLSKHPEVQGHFYPAGHGFNCDQRGSYDAPSAKKARERTLEFFRKHLG